MTTVVTKLVVRTNAQGVREVCKIFERGCNTDADNTEMISQAPKPPTSDACTHTSNIIENVFNMMKRTMPHLFGAGFISDINMIMNLHETLKSVQITLNEQMSGWRGHERGAISVVRNASLMAVERCRILSEYIDILNEHGDILLKHLKTRVNVIREICETINEFLSLPLTCDFYQPRMAIEKSIEYCEQMIPIITRPIDTFDDEIMPSD